MADAKITLTLTPGEFDLVREQMQTMADSLSLRAKESADPRAKREMQTTHARIEGFLQRLR